MQGTAASVASMLEHIARKVMRELEGVTPEDLNRQLALPECNTLFALATHLVGSGEFWVLVKVGKREIPRDRPAEFRSSGDVEALRERYERWIQRVHEVLDTFPDERLSEALEPPASSLSTPAPETRDVHYALLHAVEHSALHLGHIQLTRQLLGYSPVE